MAVAPLPIGPVPVEAVTDGYEPRDALSIQSWSHRLGAARGRWRPAFASPSL